MVGVGYWIVASHLYPPETVGRNSAAISAMMFLAGCAQLNLMSALLRFVPTAGTAATRMIVLAYLVGGGLSVLAGAIFVIGAPVWAPELVGLVSSGPSAVAFALATGLAALFVMQDNVLVALGRAAAVPVENLGFALLKLGLLAAMAVVASAAGIWLSWSIGMAAAVIGTTIYLAARAVPRFTHDADGRRETVPVGDLVRFVGPDYVGSLCWIASTTLVPVLVLGLAGPGGAAAFALPWSICLAVFHVPAAFGQSLVAVGAREPGRLEEHYRKLRRHTLHLLWPPVLLLVAAAPVVLMTFGAWYAGRGTATLRLLALSALPNAVVSLAISRARVERRTGEAAAYLVATGLIVIGLTTVCVPRIGIVGAGAGWLAAETLLAAVVLLREWRPVRRTPSAAEVSQASAALPIGWGVERILRSASDTTVVLSREGVLRTSRTTAGRNALRREREVLASLSVDARLGGWRLLLPEVIAADPEGTQLLTTRIPGSPGRHVTPAESASALAAIGRLHSCTSRQAVLAGPWLDRVIDLPAELVRARLGARAQVRSLDGLVRELRGTLAGRCEQLGWTHGDFHPGNVLFEDGNVTGIVDWDQADDSGLIALDNVFWLLTTSRDRSELGGRIVQRLRREEPWTASEGRLLGDPDPQLGRALLLLCWLGHVAGNLGKSERYGASFVWLRRNVVPVLREVRR